MKTQTPERRVLGMEHHLEDVIEPQQSETSYASSGHHSTKRHSAYGLSYVKHTISSRKSIKMQNA